MISDQYFQFIRYCVNDKVALPRDIEKMDWAGLFRFCQEQAIVGVVFQRIEELKDGKIEIPREVLLPWFALSEQIKQRNILMNKRCVELTEMLRKDGFDSCILKGQGNAVMYPNPYSRTPGDIDVWVIPTSKVEGRRSKGEGSVIARLINYVKKHNPKGRAVYHHIDYGMFNGVEVEVHYRPSFMNSAIHNGRLQRWFMEHQGEQFGHEVELPDGVGMIHVPTPAFNIVFQLSHIYNHLLHEGIGLRQMMDYYYLLRSSTKLEIRKEKLEMTLKYLGLWKFAGAVMYVMREVFGMEEQYMIVPVDERRGTVLLNEVLKGGNFGKYDEANIKANSQLKKNIQRIRRDVGMMRYFPSECLWEPLFRIYHFFWRIKWN